MSAPNRTHRRHPKLGRIFRINYDAINRFCGLQTNTFPGLSAIQTLINSFSAVVTVSWIAFPRSHINHTRILGIHRHRTDALHIHLVENGRPRDPSIHAFPNPTTGSSRVDYIAIHRLQSPFSRHRQSSNTTTHCTRTQIALGDKVHYRSQALRNHRNWTRSSPFLLGI